MLQIICKNVTSSGRRANKFVYRRNKEVLNQKICRNYKCQTEKQREGEGHVTWIPVFKPEEAAVLYLWPIPTTQNGCSFTLCRGDELHYFLILEQKISQSIPLKRKSNILQQMLQTKSIPESEIAANTGLSGAWSKIHQVKRIFIQKVWRETEIRDDLILKNEKHVSWQQKETLRWNI